LTEIGDSAAVLSRSVLEETESLVRLHSGQELTGGILPRKGGEQHRMVRIGASSAIHGSVVGKNVIIESAEKILLSNGQLAPGTEIQGSVNSLDDVNVGNGIWIQGGIIAEGDVIIDSVELDSDSPGHILIEGGVAGRNVTIGDGVVILGPVLALDNCVIGKNVTVRDTVAANNVTIGDGCMVGGLQADLTLNVGELVTIASSHILIPSNGDKVSINGPIRSPYPGCNSCPYDSFFESEMKVARKLACHMHAERSGDSIMPGSCDSWTPFPIDDVKGHLILENFHVVSHIPKDAVNTRIYGAETTLWERGGEA